MKFFAYLRTFRPTWTVGDVANMYFYNNTDYRAKITTFKQSTNKRKVKVE